MNELLDVHEFENIAAYTATLGGIEIWIGNIPYACMTPYTSEAMGYRPSRLTIKRGVKKLMPKYHAMIDSKIMKSFNK